MYHGNAAPMTSLGSGLADIGQRVEQKPVYTFRSGCTENDDFYNPTPSQAARHKARAASFEQKEKKQKSPPDRSVFPTPPLPAQNKNIAPYANNKMVVPPAENRNMKAPTGDRDNKLPAAAPKFPRTYFATEEPRVNGKGDAVFTKDDGHEDCFNKYWMMADMDRKLTIITDTELQLKHVQQESAAKDKIIADSIARMSALQDAQKALGVKDKTIADLTTCVTALQHRVISQQAHITELQTLQTVKQAIAVNGRTPATVDYEMSALAGDHTLVAQKPHQYQRPALPTPDNSQDSAVESFGTPSTNHTKFSPTANPFRMTPDPSDDVFGNGLAPTPGAPSPGKHVGVWSPAAEFGKKPLPELLSSCFKKVEAALHSLPINDIAPIKGRRSSRGEHEIFKLAQEHLECNKMAYIQFEDSDERYWLMLGMLSQEVVKHIFNDSVLGRYPSRHAAAFTRMWDVEQDLRSPKNPRCVDLVHRHKLNETRVALANTIVKTPGFWKWVQLFASEKTDEIVATFAPAFAQRHLKGLYSGLHKAVTEAIKIAIRMRQEPMIFEVFFPRHGIAWGAKFMVHRNKELVGQEITDDKPPYVVRCTALPLVKSKFFGDNTADPIVLHKAEVTVGDRKENLRPNMGRRRY